MALSSNSLVHFTSKKESLLRILAEDFKINYCKEVIRFGVMADTVLHVPMVSFCDIPLSQVKDHISKYGNYGIGLTREWAIRKGLNPVIYVESSSNLAATYDSAMTFFSKHREGKDAEYNEAFRNLWNIARYIKPYEGPLERKGKKASQYRFSDEQEWRYVPPSSSDCTPFFVGKRDSESAARIESFRLEFSPSDIKYIIIKNESEIDEFLKHLENVKGHKYSFRDVKRLMTRIITSEQIKSDF